MQRAPVLAAAAALAAALAPAPRAQDDTAAPDAYAPPIEAASDEGARAMETFRLPAGFAVAQYAAEPLLANPVAFAFDARGRLFVCETFRLHAGVTDIRSHMDWLDDDLAARTVADRLAMMREHAGDEYEERFATHHERLRLVEDTDGDRVADRATVFADGFSEAADGIAAGVLPRGDDVYYACIPSLWKLRDTDGDGVADERVELHTGYGVKVSLLGHDLHGLVVGPDGRIWFSIGDRGFSVEHAGRTLDYPNTGAVLRCEPDGSGLEVFATGLRNPQELVFDEHGDLFTGDNNSDGGDQARWVHVLEGGDSGWRSSYQWLTSPNLRGPWNAEKLWHPAHEGQPAYIVPPLANVASGPSGVTVDTGTSLPERWRGRFLLCDFRGDKAVSGIWALRCEPKGATYEVAELEEFVWGCLPTDVDFGPDGALYFSDWVHGWNQTGKGRIYRLTHADVSERAAVREVERLLREGFAHRGPDELAALLGHADRRVRLEAQLALAARGLDVVPRLRQAAAAGNPPLARRHALWALGQVYRRSFVAPFELIELLGDADAEVRAQAARCLADARCFDATEQLLPLLADPSARVRYFAALGVGHGARVTSIEPVLALLRATGDSDPALRHAGALALARIGDVDALLAHAADEADAHARMGVLLALRRLESPALATFLADADPLLVVEAARAIYDVPIDGALAPLAALLDGIELDESATQGPLLRRVLNAAFRLGGRANAEALAAFACRADAPADARLEATQMLADWSAPRAPDRVTGEWRPIEPRAGAFLPELARSIFDRIVLSARFRGESDALQVALVRLFGARALDASAGFLRQLVGDAELATRVRVAALEELAREPGDELTMALSDALGAGGRVAREGTALLASLGAERALPLVEPALRGDDVARRQGAYRALGALRGERTVALLAAELASLAAGTVPAGAQLELVLAAEAHASPRLDEALAAWRAGVETQAGGLGAWRVALEGGDAQRGRKVFFEKSETACLRCHRIGDAGGSEAGPELAGIGPQRGREHALRSIVDPNAEITAGFANDSLFLADGRVLSGRVVGETAISVQIETQDGMVTVFRDEIEERSRDLSSMPANLAEMLTREELRDLVEFLATLE